MPLIGMLHIVWGSYTDVSLYTAGKHTHADGFLCIVRFIMWAKRETWFSGIATPNGVVSGAFQRQMKTTVKSYARASHSSKFPGISISMNTSTNNTCTPEIYLRRYSYSNLCSKHYNLQLLLVQVRVYCSRH